MTAAPSTAEEWVVTAARVRASILHPHLLRARYAGPPSGGVRMELCMSPTLAEALDGGPLEARDAVAMVDDLASAVDALAARGLAPRQLSPHSIHLHHRRGAVLADAGVPATVVPRLEVVSQRARQYVSPEEVAGHRATRRSLVYTLGSILRESVSNEATAVLGDVIERATADSPGSRYAHPRAFASAAVAAAIGWAPSRRTGHVRSPRRAWHRPPGGRLARHARANPAATWRPWRGRRSERRERRRRGPQRSRRGRQRSWRDRRRPRAERRSRRRERSRNARARQRGPRHELGQRRQPRRR